MISSCAPRFNDKRVRVVFLSLLAALFFQWNAHVLLNWRLGMSTVHALFPFFFQNCQESFSLIKSKQRFISHNSSILIQVLSSVPFSFSSILAVSINNYRGFPLTTFVIMLKKTYWNSMKSENCIIPSYYNNNNTNGLTRQRVMNQDLTNYGAAGHGSYYLQSQTNAAKFQPVTFSSPTIPCMGIPSSFYPPPQNVYTSYPSGPTTVNFMDHPSKKTRSRCIPLCLAFVFICALLVGVAVWIHFYEGQAKTYAALNTIKRIVISTSLDDDFETILEDVGP